jgi:hypothetical protein
VALTVLEPDGDAPEHAHEMAHAEPAYSEA